MPFHLFQLRAMDGVGGRLLYLHCATVVPTHAEWKAIPLPDSLFPLHSFPHPVRLLARYTARR
jgi:hypothetical protein